MYRLSKRPTSWSASRKENTLGNGDTLRNGTSGSVSYRAVRRRLGLIKASELNDVSVFAGGAPGHSYGGPVIVHALVARVISLTAWRRNLPSLTKTFAAIPAHNEHRFWLTRRGGFRW